MSEPRIIMDDWKGRHNSDPTTADRILRGAAYKDCSTVCVIPTRGVIPARVVQNWLSLMVPMNQRFMRMFISGMEVGDAYNNAVDAILAHEELSKWRYLLTMEEDNMAPPDGLLKLIEDIGNGPYAGVGGLYFTKGEGGQPMCYGHPQAIPKNFIPFMPPPNSVTECNGLGMGFTLFRIEMFRKIEKPWFKTVQEYRPGEGSKGYTQDLYFCERAAKEGFRFACSSRVLVGHLDSATDIVW